MEERRKKTKGTKNPNWSREELILALELYHRVGGQLLDDRDPRVIALSQDLLKLAQNTSNQPSFRNPNGVSMKLGNLSRFDNQHAVMGRKGLRRGSKLDESVWNEFKNNTDALKIEAEKILNQKFGNPELEPEPNKFELSSPQHLTHFGTSPRIWVKAFWGFSPENSGYIGFTDEGDRKRFLRDAKNGDLVLIYGAMDKETAKEDVHIALGFLEIELEAVEDISRMSESYRLQKIENDWKDLWTYGIKVKRAWRIERNNYKIQHITKETFSENFPPHFAKRGVLLSDIEVERALSLPVREVSVYGEEPLKNSSSIAFPIKELLNPSRGINPKFGEMDAVREDGIHYLYLMRAIGCVWHLMGMSLEDFRGKAVVKIGYSNDPKRRCLEHNTAIPKRFDFEWKLVSVSRPFLNGQSAKDAEDTLKFTTFKTIESLGGEFFFGDYEKILKAFESSPEVAYFMKAAKI